MIYNLEVLLSLFWTSPLFHIWFYMLFIDPTYRFLRRQVRWSGIPISFKNFPQFVVTHIVKGFSIVNEAEVDTFLGSPFFFYDPTNVDNLISTSSAFSKSSLYIWKFSVHILLTATLKDFEHNLTSMWNEGAIVWWFEHSLALPFFETGMKTDIFQSYGHCWVFQICSCILSLKKVLLGRDTIEGLLSRVS